MYVNEHMFLTKKGARCLAAMLTNHQCLEVVLLGNNSISDAGAGSFGRALERNGIYFVLFFVGFFSFLWLLLLSNTHTV
jgi:hypothetical protein